MKKVLLLVLIAFFSIQAFSQTKYQRKSISYVNALWLATPEAKKIPAKQVDYTLSAIKKEIEMERFDYNPLPEVVIKEFVRSAKDRENLTIEEIAGIMQEKLVPEISKILQSSIEIRALPSEEQKQTFLATKAKELGITLEDIQRVMNSAYIYLPVMTGFNFEKEKKEAKATCNLEGGIIWFKVDMSGETPQVRKLAVKATKSMGFGSDKFAYESAMDQFARNLKVATQEIPDFKLFAMIAEVSGDNIKFNMGKKEGLKLDQCYFVGEYVMKPSGKTKFQKSGWTRIGKVGDNRKDPNALSSAWAVKKGDWAPGMTVIEHPRLGIDLSFKPGIYAIAFTEGDLPLDPSLSYTTDVVTVKDYTSFAYGFDFDAHMNIAQATGVRQLFATLGGNLAFSGAESVELGGAYYDLDSPYSFIWGLQMGLMKKIYIRQLALSLQGTIDWRGATLSQPWTDPISDENWTMNGRIYTLGFQPRIGLDYASNPDFNIGAMVGYKLYPEVDGWEANISSDSDTWHNLTDEGYTDLPTLNLSGLTVAVYMHWSVPALTFDPGSMMAGAMGR